MLVTLLLKFIMVAEVGTVLFSENVIVALVDAVTGLVTDVVIVLAVVATLSSVNSAVANIKNAVTIKRI